MNIDEKELQRRLNSQNNLTNVLHKQVAKPPGSKIGSVWADAVVRDTATILYSDGASSNAIGKALGTNQQNVSNWVKKPSKVAKLEDLGARDLARVAVDMGKVVQVLTPQKAESQAAVNITVYAPDSKPEHKYKTIEV
jgi:predicted transcriptional regulator